MSYFNYGTISGNDYCFLLQACSKHEEQLQCGAVFEGNELTQKRIEDLKTIGNHWLMFKYECTDKDFVPNTYVCVGKNVREWTFACEHVSFLNLIFIMTLLISETKSL